MQRTAPALLALFAAAAAVAAPARVVTLEEAVRTARERQPQLRQAHAGTQAAGARADQARSGLLPQVGLTAGYQRTTGNGINRPGVVTTTTGTGTTTGAGTAGTTSSFETYNVFSTGLTVSQLIWDFGQTTGRYHAQQAQAAASLDNERATTQQIILQVQAAFFDARANKALTNVARDNLENQRRHLNQIQAFVESGTRPDIDLFQAKTDAANAELQLINADNAYSVSRAVLNQAMGVTASTEYDVADEALTPIVGEDAQLDELLTQAIKARPEIASFEEQVRAQQLLIRSLEGAYGPSLFGNAGITQGGTALDHLGWNASIGLSLSWQLYQGGFTKAQVREAEANLTSVVAQLDVVRLQIGLELDQARLAVKAGKASIQAANEALLNAKERLKLAEGRYETGIGSIIELGDAQVALTTAAAQSVQADYRVATARAQLMKALGRP